MKSKPSNAKKGKSDANLAPPGTPDNSRGNNATSGASPSDSTSSSASSLLGLSGPSSFGGTGNRPTTGSDAGTSGAGTSSTAKVTAKSKGGTGDKGSGMAQSTLPSYPILTHFNLVDFPKINSCIVGNKGTASGATAGASGASENSNNKPLENLTMDDIDTLQAELETLWSSVASRVRVLKREEGNLQLAQSAASTHHNLGLEHFDPQHQEKIAAVDAIIGHGTRTSVSAAAKLVMGVQLAGASGSPITSPSTSAQTSSTSGGTIKKATAKGERLPKKKLKGEGGGLGKSKKGSEKPAARATQNRTHSVSSDLGSEGVFKQHEIPNQFWDSINDYCREINQDDINNLQGIIDEQSKLPDGIFDIPPLGKHYKDDEETAKRKARESRINSTKDQVGPLTQRLVGAMVDEKVSAYHNSQHGSSKEDAVAVPSPSGNSDPTYIHRPGLVKALGLDGGGASASSVPLESRVKDCLLQNGLFLPDESGDDPDDEILAEIKRTQALLRKLNQYNSEKLQSLMTVAKKEIVRYGHQRQLDKADKDLMDAYKTMQNCRLKKKPLTKKEKDGVTKALEARKKALQKIDAVPQPGPSDDKRKCSQILAGGAGSSSMMTSVAPMDPNLQM